MWSKQDFTDLALSSFVSFLSLASEAYGLEYHQSDVLVDDEVDIGTGGVQRTIWKRRGETRVVWTERVKRYGILMFGIRDSRERQAKRQACTCIDPDETMKCETDKHLVSCNREESVCKNYRKNTNWFEDSWHSSRVDDSLTQQNGGCYYSARTNNRLISDRKESEATILLPVDPHFCLNPSIVEYMHSILGFFIVSHISSVADKQGYDSIFSNEDDASTTDVYTFLGFSGARGLGKAKYDSRNFMKAIIHKVNTQPEYGFVGSVLDKERIWTVLELLKSQGWR